MYKHLNVDPKLETTVSIQCISCALGAPVSAMDSTVMSNRSLSSPVPWCALRCMKGREGTSADDGWPGDTTEV